MKPNKVFLNSDAMVNLDRGELEFTSAGSSGNYMADLTDDELDELLKRNKCELNWKGEIEDVSKDFPGEIWGVVIEIRGAK